MRTSKNFSSALVRLVALGLGSLASLGCDGGAASTAGVGASGGAGGQGQGGTSTGGAGAFGAGGQGAGCAPVVTDELVRLTVPASLEPGDEVTLCYRHTLTEDLDVTELVGTLGPVAGHHLLLLADPEPTEPDGLAPCFEPDLMDAQASGAFHMLAGVSYESDGQPIVFPSAPVQVGLRVPAGTQLVLDGHYLHTGDAPAEACGSIDLVRGGAVTVPLTFRTVLPPEQYELVVPAHDAVDVAYEEPVGGAFRVAAASGHMHEGGTHLRLSVAETGETIYETTDWASPAPKTFEAQVLLLDAAQTFRLECSFENAGATDQAFPEQMCVGGLYLLSCSFPGAC
jgi:hypothetical protein